MYGSGVYTIHYCFYESDLTLYKSPDTCIKSFLFFVTLMAVFMSLYVCIYVCMYDAPVQVLFIDRLVENDRKMNQKRLDKYVKKYGPGAAA